MLYGDWKKFHKQLNNTAIYLGIYPDSHSGIEQPENRSCSVFLVNLFVRQRIHVKVFLRWNTPVETVFGLLPPLLTEPFWRFCGFIEQPMIEYKMGILLVVELLFEWNGGQCVDSGIVVSLLLSWPRALPAVDNFRVPLMMWYDVCWKKRKGKGVKMTDSIIGNGKSEKEGKESEDYRWEVFKMTWRCMRSRSGRVRGEHSCGHTPIIWKMFIWHFFKMFFIFSDTCIKRVQTVFRYSVHVN